MYIVDNVYIHYKKCEIKWLMHSQTSPVAPFQFGNGEVISAHTLQGMWLLIHAAIEVQPW